MTDPIQQYERNAETYDRIANALSDVKQLFESASIFRQKVMLFDSTTFAIISVQNDVSILKRAFRSYATDANWEEVRDTFKHVNYGNNKFDYVRENFDTIFGEVGTEIIGLLETGEVWSAVERIVEELMGVSWVKGAFVPAMLGYTSVMCIDTNVEQMVPDDDSVASKGYKSGNAYRSAVDKVVSEFPDLSDKVSTFMLQWVVFDSNRGQGVEKHEEWFEHMLPGTPFARQTGLDSF